MTPTTVRLALASACLLVATATGCSSDDKSSDATSASADSGAVDAPAAALTISGNSFSAASVTAGIEFTISNSDGVGHTVTDDAGSFDVAVAGGESAPLTIPAAGTYAIHCKIHASMHGTISVA